MLIYGITNLVDDQYNTITQLATNPENLDRYAQGYIVWYKDWDNTKDFLDTTYYNIIDIQKDGWKIWESTARIFDCSYIDNIIYQKGTGVLEITYKEGKLIKLKYWFNGDNYFKNTNPDILKYD